MKHRSAIGATARSTRKPCIPPSQHEAVGRRSNTLDQRDGAAFVGLERARWPADAVGLRGQLQAQRDLQEQNQRLLKKAAAHPLEAVGQNSSVEGGVDFIHGEAPQLGFGVGPVKVARKEGILHLRLLLAEAV